MLDKKSPEFQLRYHYGALQGKGTRASVTTGDLFGIEFTEGHTVMGLLYDAEAVVGIQRSGKKANSLFVWLFDVFDGTTADYDFEHWTSGGRQVSKYRFTHRLGWSRGYFRPGGTLSPEQLATVPNPVVWHTLYPQLWRNLDGTPATPHDVETRPHARTTQSAYDMVISHASMLSRSKEQDDAAEASRKALFDEP